MSETANPLHYASPTSRSGRHSPVAITAEGTVTLREVSDLHYDKEDSHGWREATDPSRTFVTFLLERDWDDRHGVYLKSRDQFVRVASLPLEPEGFLLYNSTACCWDELREGVEPCKRPVRALVNGWSAGPTPFCSVHLGAITREMGDRGRWWRPVRLSYQDLAWLEDHNEFRNLIEVGDVPWLCKTYFNHRDMRRGL